MTLLTIFSAPKPFDDPHIDMIQRNAIQSWVSLGEHVEVILIGDENGLQEVADSFQIPLKTQVKRNDWGTPRVDSIFSLAREAASSPVLMYVNTDIILLPDFYEVVHRIETMEDRYLLVGRRWNLDITTSLPFNNGWAERLTSRIEKGTTDPSYTAIDYFVFPRSLFQAIPPFAIGRAGWDNWMIFHALENGWKTIDLSPSIKVVHQDHDYGHLPEGKPHYRLKESKQNVIFGGGDTQVYDLLDVQWEFKDNEIKKIPLNRIRLLRRLERWMMPDAKEGFRWRITRFIKRLRKRIS